MKVSIELRELFTNAIVGLAIAPLQPEDYQGDGNLSCQKQEPKTPLHQEHGHGDHRQTHQVTEHAHGATAEDLGQSVHITGEASEQLAHGHAVMKPHRKVDGVGEQVLANSSRESLTHRLNVEALDTLQRQPQEHGGQQHNHNQAHRHRRFKPLQKRQDRFIRVAPYPSQHGDGLAHQ